MINRPHRLIVAVDLAGQDDAERADSIARILDAIEDADPAVIAAGDLITFEMQHQASHLPIQVRNPSSHDPAEMHRRRDPHCTCADCLDHLERTTQAPGWTAQDDADRNS